ncbi:MAG TPA: hypothetical protein VHZ30_01965 [Verrucomicrobiae bacterium]|nr:hypothetical protein [Verrucomicrobiae bacterium]
MDRRFVISAKKPKPNQGDYKRRNLAETAGCMSPEEADEFQRVIDENCGRIDVPIKQESEQTKLTTDSADFTD